MPAYQLSTIIEALLAIQGTSDNINIKNLRLTDLVDFLEARRMKTLNYINDWICTECGTEVYDNTTRTQWSETLQLWTADKHNGCFCPICDKRVDVEPSYKYLEE